MTVLLVFLLITYNKHDITSDRKNDISFPLIEKKKKKKSLVIETIYDGK